MHTKQFVLFLILFSFTHGMNTFSADDSSIKGSKPRFFKLRRVLSTDDISTALPLAREETQQSPGEKIGETPKLIQGVFQELVTQNDLPTTYEIAVFEQDTERAYESNYRTNDTLVLRPITRIRNENRNNSFLNITPWYKDLFVHWKESGCRSQFVFKNSDGEEYTKPVDPIKIVLLIKRFAAVYQIKEQLRFDDRHPSKITIKLSVEEKAYFSCLPKGIQSRLLSMIEIEKGDRRIDELPYEDDKERIRADTIIHHQKMEKHENEICITQ